MISLPEHMNHLDAFSVLVIAIGVVACVTIVVRLVLWDIEREARAERRRAAGMLGEPLVRLEPPFRAGLIDDD